jgi:hypothetical protein
VKSWCERWNIKINDGKTQAIHFSRRFRVPEEVLQLNGRDKPFVNNATYLGVTFDWRLTWRLHIERTVDKALRTYLRTDSLFRNELLSTNIKLMLYNALIRSVMTSCLSRLGVTHALKLQRLQNRVLRAIGNLDRCTPVHKMHAALKIPYMHDYITKSCRTQSEVIQNHRNPIVCGIGQGKAIHRKYRRLKLGGGEAYDRSASEWLH